MIYEIVSMLSGVVNNYVFRGVKTIIVIVIQQQPCNTKLKCSPYIHLNVGSPECKRWLQLQRRAYAARGPVE